MLYDYGAIGMTSRINPDQHADARKRMIYSAAVGVLHGARLVFVL